MAVRLVQTPAPGERRVGFVGDRLRFTLQAAHHRPLPAGWRACLRTNLGRGAVLWEELLTAVECRKPPTLCAWRDIPMRREGDAWVLDLPLAEVGWFRAKACAVDERGWLHWPEGPDFGVNVQPAWCRTANTIYCAFPRMFGPSKTARVTEPPAHAAEIAALDRAGYTVIPPSGKLRDLIRELPHIFDTLGCRILHLLPVNPVPTTCARFGRFGSPYAAQDFLAIDPALVEFDGRTTGVDQFRELARAVHAHGGRLFLDLAINHTGWGSTFQERHPEWFVRDATGRFVSPGAWGTIWEDLVELDHRHAALRRELGEIFVEWCRRGVDGFRCDAGYKVPLPVWQYVIARVRREFPETVFLLEGLGGSWEATEALLTEGGMQWAYSELFQNYSGAEVAGYLDYALRQSERVGLYVHYSETHDNPRLAARGRAWSLLRNRLCALTSVSGAYGFTCGVEWLAPERVNVHSSRGLAWGNPDNLVPELAALNRLLAGHPCFFDGARLTRLSPPHSPVYALLRESAEGRDAVLVLVNTDADHPHHLRLDGSQLARAHLRFDAGQRPAPVDLLGQPLPACEPADGQAVRFQLPPGAAYCLAGAPAPAGLAGDAYRQRRAREALALQALSLHLPLEQLGQVELAPLADWLARDPVGCLSAIAALPADIPPDRVQAALESRRPGYPRVIEWQPADRTRVLPVPPGHWLLVREAVPFRATLEIPGAPAPVHAVSTPLAEAHVAVFAPRAGAGDATLTLERYGPGEPELRGVVRLLSARPQWTPPPCGEGRVLLTNGRGGMARLAVNLGAIESKYDCLLGANLHPEVPVDRHIFAKRARVWVNADGFLSPLNADNLLDFAPGPPPRWRFLAHAGDGRGVEIHFAAAMLPGRNTTVLRFHRPAAPPPQGRDLPAGADVRLTVRVDLEDRNFHHETKHNPGADHHFRSHTRPLAGAVGFEFAPAADRRLRVRATAGYYHDQPEWSFNIAHPLEQSRGLEGSGDAYSPGWFELPLARGDTLDLVVCADPDEPAGEEITHALEPVVGPAGPAAAATKKRGDGAGTAGGEPAGDEFAERLRRAVEAFVVRRGRGWTVIAGYPWFLDWGRDALIAARGLLAAGRAEIARQILLNFARWERDGTLPNAVFGHDASNRDTSDAPLWFGVVAGEFWEQLPDPAARREFLATRVDETGRDLAAVLRSIAAGYLRGTPNGIRVDAASRLVFSPAHFTWMDTNHPAGTPREGYPVEIQALWVCLLRRLAELGLPAVSEPWGDLARRAAESFARRFWLEEHGWCADVLLARPGQPAADAVPQNALRGNALLAVTLGLLTGERARRQVEAARRWLLVPGAVRSLAPLPVRPPLEIRGRHGELLNDPERPYWGRYEGDEDTRRKPAYHNGTAWVWLLPQFCEALARAWDFDPAAVAAARAYLAGTDRLLAEGCLGQLPEILDGDAPHTQRGCDAQAWSVTETLRVWTLLEDLPVTPVT
jgi:predicted glycogen debranching enzyme